MRHMLRRPHRRLAGRFIAGRYPYAGGATGGQQLRLREVELPEAGEAGEAPPKGTRTQPRVGEAE